MIPENPRYIVIDLTRVSFYRFNSHGEALEKAEALARSNPGMEYHVYHLHNKFWADAPELHQENYL